MSFNCEEIKKKLYEEGADAFSEDELCHINSCKNCKKEKEELETALSLLKSAVPGPTKNGEYVSDAVARRIESEKIARKEPARFRFPYATVAAAAVVLLAFSVSQTGILGAFRAANSMEKASAPETELYDMANSADDYGIAVAESKNTGAGSASGVLKDECEAATGGLSCPTEKLETESVCEKFREYDFSSIEKLVEHFNGKYQADFPVSCAKKVSCEQFEQWALQLQGANEYCEEEFNKYFGF